MKLLTSKRLRRVIWAKVKMLDILDLSTPKWNVAMVGTDLIKYAPFLAKILLTRPVEILEMLARVNYSSIIGGV